MGLTTEQQAVWLARIQAELGMQFTTNLALTMEIESLKQQIAYQEARFDALVETRRAQDRTIAALQAAIAPGRSANRRRTTKSETPVPASISDDLS